MTDGHDTDVPADRWRDDPDHDPEHDPGIDEPEGPPRAASSPPSMPEGVRIIGAEEAQAAIDTGHASPRKSESEMRFGDVPPRPDPSVRPAARFPSPAVPTRAGDDTAARPVVPRVASPSAVPPPSPGADRPPGPPSAAGAERGPGSESPTGALFDPPETEVGADPGGAPDEAALEIESPDDLISDDSLEIVLHGDGEPGGPGASGADPAPAGRDAAAADDVSAEQSAPMPLPHWTEPPTGEVPRILPEAEPVDMTDEEDFAAWAALAGGEPRFRSRAGDWDDDEAALVDALGPGSDDDAEDLGALSEPGPPDDDSAFAEQVARRRRIRSRSAARAEMTAPAGSVPPGARAERPPTEAPASDDVHVEVPDHAAEEPVPQGAAGARRDGSSTPPEPPEPPRRSGGPRVGARRPQPTDLAPEPAPDGADLATRVVTGIAVAVVALICLKLGAGATTVLAAVIVGVASFELYEGLRRATFRPAAILGMLGSVGLVFAAYERGDAAFPLITSLVVVFTLLWYLIEVVRARPTVNVGATLIGFGYVGVLGGFAGLILALPDGVGIILGLAISAVGYDVFGFLIGSQFGRTRLAPTVSPNKTVEGLIGGMCAAVVLGVVTSSVIGLHPWSPSIGRGLALGAVVAVMAPLGDLCESMIKRDLRVKDLGAILPGHGGVLDRFDAVLFCLPAAYYLARHLFG